MSSHKHGLETERNNGSKKPRITRKEPRLLPLPVLPFAPVRQQERQHYLRLLHNEYVGAKFEAPIQTTVDKEFELATKFKTRNEYMNGIKRLMFNLKKYGRETKDPVQPSELAPEELGKRLSKLVVPKRRLADGGFVMEVPERKPLPDYVTCRRCDEKFSRRKQFIDREPTVCYFHPGKKVVRRDTNLKESMGMRRQYTSRYYSCCNELVAESRGCRHLPSHVFKPDEPGYLQDLKPFRTIGELRKSFNIRDDEKAQIERKKKIRAVGIDCEMCFTDLGFELMKLSVVDFDTLKPLVNNLVAPEGEVVVDLNSEVSGVYEVPKPGNGVLTFDEAMVCMAQLTDNDTVIVGHGLENDLNVLRIVYDRIVDTAVLFSDNQLDPMRKDPLKKLAWKYLSRNIQQSEHDPLEDATVPIEVVKKVLHERKYGHD